MILLTGGNGLLGSEMKKYMNCVSPTHKEMDITKDIPEKYQDAKMVIHAAAYTDVAKAEVEKSKCFKTNVEGTINLVKTFSHRPFVFLSTEYVYEPTNFYTYTKVEAEAAVMEHKRYLIIRTLFKPRPFPYPKAFIDQYTRGDYVDVIAPMIVAEIMRWDENTNNIVDIGTKKKTMFELAIQSRKVEPCFVNDITEVKLPRGINVD